MEKIVFNLLSNAFKFTFEGEIKVSLHANARWIWSAARVAPVIIPCLIESNALNAGYELHFSKPINLSELAHAIAQLSGKK